jgi:hypothetical protein
MNLSTDVRIVQVLTATATGTTAINTNIVDMQGYDGVLFLASIGSGAVNNGMKAQQGQIANMSDAADLAGTNVPSSATATTLALDLYRPLDRYVRAVITRGTTTTIDAVFAILYRGAKKPVNNASSTLSIETWVSPAEGTA